MQLDLFSRFQKARARWQGEKTPVTDDAGELLTKLRALTGKRIRGLTLTDNRTRIFSARARRGETFDLRIHRSFADAPDEVLEAVAAYLLSRRRGAARRRALATVREYFNRHGPAEAPAPERRRIVLRPVGRVVDLRELRDEINRRYFDDRLEVAITWGRAPSRRRAPRRRGRRQCGFSIRLGTYTERDNLVRIHRSLDRADVPRYVVESVVYHEMLHAALPAVVRGGRRYVHTPEFRRREKLFHHHRQAERWIERNLERLAGVGG